MAKKLTDLTGQRVNRLTVIEKSKKKGNGGKTCWECLCDCGNIKTIENSVLRNGFVKSCGCSKEKDLLGKKFGKLIVIGKSEKKGKNGNSYWECLCECGKKTIKAQNNLSSGKTKSCGCLKNQNLIGFKTGKITVIEKINKPGLSFWKCECSCGNYIVLSQNRLNSKKVKSCGCLTNKHGKSNTRLYKIWLGIKKRCFNQNFKSYKHYGGRGITICKEWLDFSTFEKWALENGYDEKLSIDRINVDGIYEPNNCRWATTSEQARNKRNSIKLSFEGVEKTLTDWSAQYNINKVTASHRYKKGLQFEEIFEINKEKK